MWLKFLDSLIINKKIRMKSMYAAAAVGLLNGAFADTIVLPPPTSASGDQVAIVWIHGASCDPAAYTTFAAEIQS